MPQYVARHRQKMQESAIIVGANGGCPNFHGPKSHNSGMPTDEDIESVPSCYPDSLQNSSNNLWDMHAWRREVSNILKCLGRNRKKILKDIVQAMAELITLAEENFDIQESLIKPRKADHESEEHKRVLKASAAVQRKKICGQFLIGYQAP